MSYSSTTTIVDYLFRQKSGKMVSVLVKMFGPKHLELAEDVVQNTLIKALELWKFNGPPENPKAWLYRVAKNNALDIIRRENRSQLLDLSDPEQQLLNSEYTLASTVDQIWQEDRIKDEFLSMMFACCHPEISTENQITFILKTLCGFSTKEVAKAFLTTEDVISKRLYRTKEYFRTYNTKLELPAKEQIKKRISTVCTAIYLLFNEGYHSTNSDDLIRQDLIAQALYLCKVLLDYKYTNLPEVNALMSLMCFHAARSESRVSEEGEIILLADQDRTGWNEELISAGRNYLFHSGSGDHISHYHFEALIAYEHCTAKKYEDTNWLAIWNYYVQLLAYKFDPIVYFNQCMVVLELKGAKAALQALNKLEGNKFMQAYSLYYSAQGEIYIKLDKMKKAKEMLQRAKGMTKSKQEKTFLEKKLTGLK